MHFYLVFADGGGEKVVLVLFSLLRTDSEETLSGLVLKFKFSESRDRSAKRVIIKVNSSPFLRVSKFDLHEKLRT